MSLIKMKAGALRQDRKAAPELALRQLSVIVCIVRDSRVEHYLNK